MENSISIDPYFLLDDQMMLLGDEKTLDFLLLTINFLENIIEIPTRFTLNTVEEHINGDSVSELVCLGRSDCAQLSVFQLSCPHKSSFKACTSCFPPTFKKQRRGCPDDYVGSIQLPSAAKREGDDRMKKKTLPVRWLYPSNSSIFSVLYFIICAPPLSNTP